MTALGLAVRWIHLSAGLFLVGAFAMGLLAGRSDKPTARAWDMRLARWTRRAAVLVLLSGLAVLAYQAAAATGRPSAALEPAAWLHLLLNSQFGTVWLVRHGVLFLLAALVFLSEREGSTTDWAARRVEGWLLAAVAAAAMAWAGHAAAVTPGAPAAALVDALHLVAAGTWLGALLPLTVLLAAASAERGADARPFAVLAARRFSRAALAVMAVIVATGLWNAWTQVGGIAGLVGTRYGRLLLLKLLLLAVVLVLAGLNRRLLPALAGDGDTVGRPAMAKLARFVAGEWGIALLLLAVTSALGLTPPGRHESPWWPFSFRFSWAATADLPGAKTRVLLGSQLAVIGLLAVVAAVLIRRARAAVLAMGALAAAGGLWIALPPMAVDAYPTTYRRSTIPYQASSIASGMALFAAHCAICHGVDGMGDGPGGAGLPKRPADLTAPHTAQHTAGDLFWWITHGIPAGGMPAFGDRLSEAERWDLINFLRAIASGAQARELTHLVEPNRPRLAAPDFVYAVGPTPQRNLKDFRDRWMLLLVLFSLPESGPRLAQLADAYGRLQFSGAEVLAVPRDADPGILRRLAVTPPALFPVVTEGAAEIVQTYGLFTRGLEPLPPLRVPPGPRHVEFLIDRQGYLRARWIPGGPSRGWQDLDVLVKEIQILDREAPSAPPDEHVH